MEAQAFIIKYLGASEHTHVRNCTAAYEMWNSPSTLYELQGEIEIYNATAQLSAIVMTEAIDIVVYVRRLQELHKFLDRQGEQVTTAKQSKTSSTLSTPSIHRWSRPSDVVADGSPTL